MASAARRVRSHLKAQLAVWSGASLIGLTAVGGAGCRHTADSSSRTKVYGGDAGSSAFPSSLRMHVVGASGGTTRCGGGFITDAIFLTSAHCLTDGDKRALNAAVYFTDHFPVMSDDFQLHPEFRDSMTTELVDHEFHSTDVALLRFPPGTCPPELIVKLATVPPKRNDTIGFAGFGVTQVFSSELSTTKVVGYNKIDSIDPVDGALYLTSPFKTITSPSTPTNMAAAQIGDSGSLVYNERGEAIGLVATGDEYLLPDNPDKVRGIIHTTMLSLFNPRVQEFMEHEAGLSTRSAERPNGAAAKASGVDHSAVDSPDRSSSEPKDAVSAKEPGRSGAKR